MKIRFPSELIYFLIAGISIAGLYGVLRLRFEFQYTDYFVHGHRTTEEYLSFRNTFNPETEENAILIGIRSDSGVFQSSFLSKLDTCTRSLMNLVPVDKVYSLSNTFVYSLQQGNWLIEPLVHSNSAESYPKDSAYIYASKEYRNILLSKTGASTLISVFLKPYLSDPDQLKVLQEIEALVSKAGFHSYHIISKSKLIKAYTEELRKNMLMFIAMTSLTLILCMLWMYGSIQFVALSFLILALSVLWTLGLSYYIHGSFDFLGSLLVPAIATITMTSILHIRQYFDQHDLLFGQSKISIHDYKYGIGKAVFLTSLTTAIGFLSFDTSNILPLHHFGRMAAFGIFTGLGLSLFFLYIWFAQLKNPAGMSPTWNKWFAEKKLVQLYHALFQHQRKVLLFLLMICVWACALLPQIELNGSLISEIPEKSDAFKDSKFIESEFGGGRSFEMVLSANSESEKFSDLQSLQVSDQIVRFLEDSLKLSFVISPVSMLKAANKAFSGGDPSLYNLPDNQEKLNQCFQAVEQTQYGQDLRRFLSDDKSQLRISGRMPEISIKEYQIIEKKLADFFKKLPDKRNLKYSLTGASHVLDKTPGYLAENMVYSLLLAFILIALIAWSYLKNWIAIPIAILPNLIPLLIVAGIMAQFKIYLKMDTAILFPIALGMSVDNTIHFFHKLKSNSSAQHNIGETLQRSFIEVFKPVTLNMLVLLAGFSALLLSSFESAQKIGVILCACLLLGWACNLTLLPLFFSYLSKNIGKKL